MKLYNNKKGIILFVIIFLLWSYMLGQSCLCNKNTKCVRYEFYGVQLNHFFLFIFLGAVFPSHFITFQIMGVLWELFEFFLDKHPEYVEKYIGGCLSSPPMDYNHEENKPWNYIVYKGIPKPLNPIDKFFKIENSQMHAWHGSPAEIVPNILGFLVGMVINKITKLHKYF